MPRRTVAPPPHPLIFQVEDLQTRIRHIQGLLDTHAQIIAAHSQLIDIAVAHAHRASQHIVHNIPPAATPLPRPPRSIPFLRAYARSHTSVQAFLDHQKNVVRRAQHAAARAVSQ